MYVTTNIIVWAVILGISFGIGYLLGRKKVKKSE